VEIFRDIRPISRQDTMFLLRYTLGIAIEIAVAFWLLSVARGEYAWAAWIAYLILTVAALATLIGLSWCCLWFADRALGWSLAAILCLVGAWLLTSWTKLSWDDIVRLGFHAH
jgi:apolipoprotein N-acyltransferase